MVIEGYKAFYCDYDGTLFSKNHNYREPQLKHEFKVGETYVEEKAVLCQRGFHYCKSVLDVFNYYPFNSVVCKVTDINDGDESPTDGIKSCTAKLRIDSILDGEVIDKNTRRSVYFKNGQLHSPQDDDFVCFPVTEIKLWFKQGHYHRDGDLPAIEHKNGTKEWYQNGFRHRDGDLPAIEKENETKEWWKEGKRHRDGNLPAVEYATGGKEWFKDGLRQYIGGINYERTSMDINQLLQELHSLMQSSSEKIKTSYNKKGQLHSENDLPAVETKNGMKQWYKNGKLHRDNGLPAIEHEDGMTKEWFQNGWRHRDNNLPAIVFKDGWRAWFKDGWGAKKIF